MNRAVTSEKRAAVSALILSFLAQGCADGGVGEASESVPGSANPAIYETDVRGVSVATVSTDDAFVSGIASDSLSVALTGDVDLEAENSTPVASLTAPTVAAALPVGASVSGGADSGVAIAGEGEAQVSALTPEEVAADREKLEAVSLAEAAARREREQAEADSVEASRLAAETLENARLDAEAERLAQVEAAERLAAEEDAERIAAELAEADLEAGRAEVAENVRSEAERELAEKQARLAEEDAARELAEEQTKLAELEAARLEQEREAARVAEEEAARVEADEAESEQARKAAENASDDVIKIGRSPGDARCLDLSEDGTNFGSVDKDNWRSWASDVRFSTGGEFLSVERGSDGRQTLRQKFAPASNGSARVIMGADLEGRRTYRLTQSFFLEPGWDWGGDKNQGGKMGFGFGGGTTPSGGKRDTAGFTARFMWKGNRDGTAKARVYSYAADRPSVYGEDIVLEGFSIPIGEWFDLTLEVTTNSSTGASDGSVRAWANDQLLVHRENMGWQTSGGTPLVENLYYSGFYGGNDPSWAPDDTTYMRQADVCWSAVVDGYSGIDPDIGRTRVPHDLDGTGGPGVFSDDNLPYVATTRGTAVDRIEGARTRVEFMLPTNDMVADDTLVRTVDLLNASLDSNYWASDDAARLDAPAILGLYGSVRELNQPWLAGSDSAAIADDARAIAQVLAVTAADLAESTVVRAEKAATLRGCLDGSIETICGAVRDDIGAARAALMAMQAAAGDTLTATAQAAEAWARAISALTGLSS